MGYESQIEPWLAHDQRSACWFHKSLASSQIEYENHTRGRSHQRLRSYPQLRSVPSLWSGIREQSRSNPRGLKVNKNQPRAKCFLLTFLLIELDSAWCKKPGSVANCSRAGSALYQYEVSSYTAVSRTFRLFQTSAGAYDWPHLR